MDWSAWSVGKGKGHAKENRALVGILKELRVTRGFTQGELAEALGKPQSYISKIERGERLMDPVELRQIVEALGQDLTAIVRLWVARTPH